MQFLKVALVLALFSMSASLSWAQTHSELSSGIEGIITISPIRPGPIRQDMPSAGPFANGTFTVQNETGIVTSFTTDAEGRFRVSLPPGHYTVTKKDGQRGVGHFGPFEVDVAAGKMTPVEWRCDSGMR
jgi:hypothetical protein